MKLPIGQLCVVIYVDNPRLQHLIGHYCEVVQHDPIPGREYRVIVKSDGDDYYAERKHLLPINPDEPLRGVRVEEVEEVTA